MLRRAARSSAGTLRAAALPARARLLASEAGPDPGKGVQPQTPGDAPRQRYFAKDITGQAEPGLGNVLLTVRERFHGDVFDRCLTVPLVPLGRPARAFQ